MNQLMAMKDICAAVDPNDPSTCNYASEYASHILFFDCLKEFDDKMNMWLPMEQKLRREVFQQGLFNQGTWLQEVHSVLAAEAAVVARFGTVMPMNTVTPAKCAVGKDGNSGTSKRPRGDREQGHGDEGMPHHDRNS